MRKFVLTAALGAACLGLAACGDREADTTADTNVAGAGEGGEATTGGDANTAGAGGTAAAGGGGDWKGARIVEENGKTYRINADGTRVELGDNDARIVVENGTRYRVDRDGTRVRIDERGLDIDLPDIDGPDVDVGINEKGNPDIDVKANKDGDSGPN